MISNKLNRQDYAFLKNAPSKNKLRDEESFMLVAPSLLAADFSRLGEELERVSSAPWLHLDVMDGVFVPNISFGIPIIEKLRLLSKQVFDVHLMVDRPKSLIKSFAEAGADVITVHPECADDTAELIAEIKRCGKLAGLAIKPNTPVSEVLEYLDEVYVVMVMTVEPGFGGQKLIAEALPKVQELKQRRADLLVELDGGVNEETFEACVKSGADVLVAGTAVFGAENAQEKIEFFSKA